MRVPHFYFGEVTQKNEFNREIITVAKKMMRRDEYNDWIKHYDRVKACYH